MLFHSSEPLHKLCLSWDNLCFLLSLSFKTQAQVTSLLESLLLFFTLILKPLLGASSVQPSTTLLSHLITAGSYHPSPHQTSSSAIFICPSSTLLSPSPVCASQVFNGFTSSLHLPGSSVSSRPLFGNIAF